MPRVDDLPFPAVDRHPIPPGAPLDLPAVLTVALERLPQAAYTWDDPDEAVVWDAPDDAYVWDAPFVGGGFTDVVCDVQAVQVDAAEPDELGLVGPTVLTVSLANPDGRYTVWTADGRLAYWAPGRRACVWATIDGEAFWLFSGRVASWTEAADGSVVVEAFDGLAALADPLGGEWTAGTDGDVPLERIGAIAALAGYTDPIVGPPGDVALTVPEPDDAAPLDAIQRVAMSDGGLFGGDADGRLVYRDRTWRTGRADQVTIPVVSDNVCTVPVVVWDLELAADDDGLFNDVALVNVAGLTARATLADEPGAWFTGPGYRLTHPDPDLWTGQAEGDDLAEYLLAMTSTPAMAPRAFTLHLTDPTQDLWRVGIDLRRGDRLELLHAFTDAGGDPAELDVVTIAAAVDHVIIPDTASWTVTVVGTRTVDWRTIERWDETAYTWDDPDPLNVWRH